MTVTRQEINTIRNLTKEQVVEVGSLLLTANQAQLELVINDLETPVLKAMLAKVAQKVLRSGDAIALNVLLDRFIGKVKDTVELSGPNGGPISMQSAIMHLGPEERKARIEKLREIRNEVEGYDL